MTILRDRRLLGSGFRPCKGGVGRAALAGLVASMLMIGPATSWADELDLGGAPYEGPGVRIKGADTRTGLVSLIFNRQPLEKPLTGFRFIALDRYPPMAQANQAARDGRYDEAVELYDEVKLDPADAWVGGLLLVMKMQACDKAGRFTAAVDLYVRWAGLNWALPQVSPPANLPPKDSPELPAAVKALEKAVIVVGDARAQAALRALLQKAHQEHGNGGATAKSADSSGANSNAGSGDSGLSAANIRGLTEADLWGLLADYGRKGPVRLKPAAAQKAYEDLVSEKDEALFQSLYGKRFNDAMTRKSAETQVAMAQELTRGANLAARQSGGLARRMLLAARDLVCKANTDLAAELSGVRSTFESLCDKQNPRHLEGIIRWDVTIWQATRDTDLSSAYVEVLTKDVEKFAHWHLDRGAPEQVKPLVEQIVLDVQPLDKNAAESFDALLTLAKALEMGQKYLRSLEGQLARNPADESAQTQLAILHLCYLKDVAGGLNCLKDVKAALWEPLVAAGKEQNAGKTLFLLAEGIYGLATMPAKDRPKCLPKPEHLKVMARDYYLNLIQSGKASPEDVLIAQLRLNELQPGILDTIKEVKPENGADPTSDSSTGKIGPPPLPRTGGRPFRIFD